MADYDQEEALTRLLDFWGRYKFHLITGLLMILSAVSGLSYQTTHNDALQREAGNALYQVMRAADAGEAEAAAQAYQQINKSDDFAGLRHLAAFALASVQVQNDNAEEARSNLQAVVDNEKDDGLRALAALRLSELLINAGETDEAVTLLEENAPLGSQMQLLFAERRGDAHFTARHYLQARGAYEEAFLLAAENNHQSYLPVINIKIGALLSHRSILPLASGVAKDNDTEDSLVPTSGEENQLPSDTDIDTPAEAFDNAVSKTEINVKKSQ